VAVAWGYAAGFTGAKGIQYISKVALVLPIVPALLLLFAFFKTAHGIASYHVPDPNPRAAFALTLQAVIGFFATAGAAGVDFGMNSRDASDVKLGGIWGIVIGIIYSGGLPLLATAGAHGVDPDLGFTYQAVINFIGGFSATAMFLLFAVASVASSCFCAFIAGNSFATMIPGMPRITLR
jgi:cytosine permease